MTTNPAIQLLQTSFSITPHNRFLDIRLLQTVFLPRSPRKCLTTRCIAKAIKAVADGVVTPGGTQMQGGQGISTLPTEDGKDDKGIGADR